VNAFCTIYNHKLIVNKKANHKGL